MSAGDGGVRLDELRPTLRTITTPPASNCARCGCPWHNFQCASASHEGRTCPAAITIERFSCDLLEQQLFALANISQQLQAIAAILLAQQAEKPLIHQL